MASKKYKNEEEVVIQTITDKEINDYAPPIVSAKQTNVNMITDKNADQNL